MSILSRMGLTHDETQAVISALCNHAEYSVRAELQTRYGDTIQRVAVGSGQIDVDASGRKGQVELNDDDGQLSSIDPESLLRKQIAIWYRVYSERLQSWFEIPVGCGPIVKADPGDQVMQVNFRGRADLANNDVLEAKTLLKGHLVTNAITTTLTDWSGLNPADIKLPTLQATLPKDRTYPRGARVWPIAVELAQSVNMDLLFDGAGKTLMRRTPDGQPTFEFFDANPQGDPETVVTLPQRDQTIRDDNGDYLPNWVILHGVRKSKGQAAVDGEWFADPASPISRETLAINNVDQAHKMVVSNPHVKEVATANKIAKSIGERAEQTSQAVTFDAVRLPFFDFNDLVAVHTSTFTATFNLTSFSLPLGANDSATMSIGYTRPVSFAGARAKYGR